MSTIGDGGAPENYFKQLVSKCDPYTDLKDHINLLREDKPKFILFTDWVNNEQRDSGLSKFSPLFNRVKYLVNRPNSRVGKLAAVFKPAAQSKPSDEPSLLAQELEQILLNAYKNPSSLTELFSFVTRLPNSKNVASDLIGAHDRAGLISEEILKSLGNNALYKGVQTLNDDLVIDLAQRHPSFLSAFVNQHPNEFVTLVTSKYILKTLSFIKDNTLLETLQELDIRKQNNYTQTLILALIKQIDNYSVSGREVLKKCIRILSENFLKTEDTEFKERTMRTIKHILLNPGYPTRGYPFQVDDLYNQLVWSFVRNKGLQLLKTHFPIYEDYIMTSIEMVKLFLEKYPGELKRALCGLGYTHVENQNKALHNLALNEPSLLVDLFFTPCPELDNRAVININQEALISILQDIPDKSLHYLVPYLNAENSVVETITLKSFSERGRLCTYELFTRLAKFCVITGSENFIFKFLSSPTDKPGYNYCQLYQYEAVQILLSLLKNENYDKEGWDQFFLRVCKSKGDSHNIQTFLQEAATTIIPCLVELAKDRYNRQHDKVVDSFFINSKAPQDTLTLLQDLAKEKECYGYVKKYLTGKTPDDTLKLLQDLEKKHDCHEFILDFLSTEGIRTFDLETNEKNRQFVLNFLSQKDSGGYTILHRSTNANLQQALSGGLITLLGGTPWLNTLRNNMGLTPLQSVEINGEFLNDPKHSLDLLDPVKTGEYATRALQLTERVTGDWSNYIKELNSAELKEINNTKLTDTCLLDLKKMLDKISKKFFYGADEKDLDAIYLRQLDSFEKIMTSIQECPNPKEKVNYLVQVSNMVNVCAKGYQEGLDQIRDLLSTNKEAQTTDGRLKYKAESVLRDLVEKVAARFLEKQMYFGKEGNAVHQLGVFRFAMGFSALQPDTWSQAITRQNAQRLVLEAFKDLSFVTDFGEIASPEDIDSYFSEKCTDEDPSLTLKDGTTTTYKTLEESTKRAEDELVGTIINSLKNVIPSEVNAKIIAAQFNGLRGVSLTPIFASPDSTKEPFQAVKEPFQAVIDYGTQKLSNLLPKQKIDLLSLIPSPGLPANETDEKTQTLEKLLRRIPGTIPGTINKQINPVKKNLLDAISEIKNLLYSAKAFTVAMEQACGITDVNQLNEILKIREQYNEGLKTISTNLPQQINEGSESESVMPHYHFDRGFHGKPSTAIKAACQLDVGQRNEDYFREFPNAKLLKVLTQMGVLQITDRTPSSDRVV
ncbi:MAG: hypothetical protein WCF65_07500 [Parachlamydiaceae bacterium]